MTDARDLDGKVALVVGGTRNLGAAIADQLAAAGATTVVSYRDGADAAGQTVARLRRHQVDAEAVRSDATVAADVDSLFESVVTRQGRVDITVHVPGAVTKKPLADFTDADFDHLIDLNTRSAFHTLRAASRYLADGGRCIVLSTTLTSVMAGPYGVYSGAKAAVERMVLAAAILPASVALGWVVPRWPSCFVTHAAPGRCDGMSRTSVPPRLGGSGRAVRLAVLGGH